MNLRRAIGILFTLELCLIWALGSWPLWTAGAASGVLADPLLRAASLVGLGMLLLLWRAMAANKGPLAHWQGTLQFAACWVIFLLFKVIRQYWVGETADGALLALDRALFAGQSLPERLLAWEQPVLSEVLSGGYFSFYFVILLPALWFSARRQSSEARAFFLGLSFMYLVGFAGYLLVPAGGPYLAFPGIFPYPPDGGPVTAFLVAQVAQGISGMDVFPSLHSGITLYILGFFWSGRPRPGYGAATALLLPIFASIVVATVYLRYHYGIDLIGGILLGGAAIALVRKHRQKENP